MTPFEFGEIGVGLAACGSFFMWVVSHVVSEAVYRAMNGLKQDVAGVKTDVAVLKGSVDRLTRAEDRRVEMAGH